MMWHPDIEIKVLGRHWEQRATRLQFHCKNNMTTYVEVVRGYGWSLSIVIFVTAVSNGANLTDGLDGLATGTSNRIHLRLAYVSSSTVVLILRLVHPRLRRVGSIHSGFCRSVCGILWYNLSQLKYSWAIQDINGRNHRGICNCNRKNFLSQYYAESS